MPIPSFPPRGEETLGSRPAVVAGASAIRNVVTLSQTAYDALAVKDSQTLYVVTPDPA